MAEYVRRDEQQAHAERRGLINQGRSVSLIAYDPARDAYVFDVYEQDA